MDRQERVRSGKNEADIRSGRFHRSKQDETFQPRCGVRGTFPVQPYLRNSSEGLFREGFFSFPSRFAPQPDRRKCATRRENPPGARAGAAAGAEKLMR